MAYKRKSYRGRRRYGRRYRKRTMKRYRYKRGNNPLRTAINRYRVTTLNAKNVFPEKVKVKMGFVDNVVLSSAVAGATVNQVYRGNSIFDPDQSGTGFQPCYYDDLASLYSKYTVIASKIMVNFTNSSDAPALCSVYPYEVSGDTVAIEETGLNPRARYFVLKGQVGGGQRTVKSFARTQDLLGILPLADDTQFTATNTNPGQQWYWQIRVKPQNVLETVEVNVAIKIIYYVVWTARRSQNED